MNDFTRILIATLSGAALTFLLLYFMPFGKFLLGHDRGRKYVPGAEVNIGKPTGTGIYFILAFIISVVIFSKEGSGIYLIMILTYLMAFIGFLDDRSSSPWGEYSKAALDIIISVIGGLLFVRYFGNSLVLSFTGNLLILNPIVYICLAVLLTVVSINATNATDGVDGLSGSLAVLSLITLMTAARMKGLLNPGNALPGAAMIAVLAVYLCFNRYPSKLLMGDAGSRAIGFFIAFYFMYLKLPLSYLIICLPFLLDGGMSILKITIGRITRKKIIIFPSLITPVHDHLKKKLGFTVPKTWGTIVFAALITDIIYLLAVALI